MGELRALVDEDCGEHLLPLCDSLTARGVEPIRIAGAKAIGNVINIMKVSGVFLSWDAHRAASIYAIRLVRASKSNQGVPITVVTESPATSVVAGAARVGADFFLTTPFEPNQLQRLLAAKVLLMREEQRSYQRVPLVMPVLCRWGDAERRCGQSVNVSPSGMLLELSPRPRLGSRLILAFGITQLQQEFVVPAVVVRVDESERVGLRYVWNSELMHEELKSRLDAQQDTVWVSPPG